MSQKTTDLSPITAAEVADTDSIMMVDKDDTTMDPSGTNKEMTFAELAIKVGGGGGGGGASAPNKVLVEKIVDPGVGGFVFNNIPADASRIVIHGELYSTLASGVGIPKWWVNGDEVEANYDTQLFYGTDSTVADNRLANTNRGLLVSTGNQSAFPATFTLVIENPQSAGGKHLATYFTSRKSDGDVYQGSHAVLWKGSGPLTSLKLVDDNDPTETLIGYVALYAEKDVSLEDSNTITVKQLVSTITNPAAGEFDFDLSDFQDGDRLVVKGKLRGDVVAAASTGEGLLALINGATTGYHRQYNYGNNGSAWLQEDGSNYVGTIPNANSPADSFADVEFVIENYGGSGAKIVSTTLGAELDTGHAMSGMSSLFSSETGAVTSFTLRTDNYPTDGLTGTLSCYVEKQGVLPVTPSSAGRTEIETIDNTSVAGEFDFDNIPAGYKRLIVKGYMRGDAAATGESIRLFLNTDTTDSNYHNNTNQVDNGGTVDSEADNAYVATVPGGSSPAGSHALFEAEIEGYDTGILKVVSVEYGGTQQTDRAQSGSVFLTSAVTDAVTRVRIRTDNHATDLLFGMLTLYGEN